MKWDCLTPFPSKAERNSIQMVPGTTEGDRFVISTLPLCEIEKQCCAEPLEFLIFFSTDVMYI